MRCSVYERGIHTQTKTTRLKEARQRFFDAIAEQVVKPK